MIKEPKKSIEGLIVGPGGELRHLSEFPLLVGLYEGRSKFSRAIQFRTWSKFSHASKIGPHGDVIEAWIPHGVRHAPHYCEDHTSGTVIHCFEWPGLTVGEVEAVNGFLLSQVGKHYDYLGALRFMTRTRPLHFIDPTQASWFCSELLFAASLVIRKPWLLRIPAWKVPPGLIELSPRLNFVGKLTIGETHRRVAA